MVGETATAAGKESTVRQTFGGPPHFGRNDIASRMRFKDPLVAISFLPLQGGGGTVGLGGASSLRAKKFACAFAKRKKSTCTKISSDGQEV